MPFRRPDAPNGVDERLSVDMITEAKSHDARRLSLAFAAFPEIFDASRPGPLQRVALWAIHLLDPLIRLESLYRYLREFSCAVRPALRGVVCPPHPSGADGVVVTGFVPRPRHLWRTAGTEDCPQTGSVQLSDSSTGAPNRNRRPVTASGTIRT